MTGIALFGCALIVLSYLCGHRDGRKSAKRDFRNGLLAYDRINAAHSKSVGDRQARDAEYAGLR
jgi:hypothetical protein